jgi:hypothetical protein
MNDNVELFTRFISLLLSSFALPPLDNIMEIMAIIHHHLCARERGREDEGEKALKHPNQFDITMRVENLTELIFDFFIAFR